MSVLKTSLANPSRMAGIYRYLLHAKGQREDEDILAKRLSPDELVKDKPSPRPMFEASLRECLKCGLLVKEETEITINPDFPEIVRDPQTGEQQLSNTLADLFFASGNEDEADFALDCAWYLSQDIYNAPKNWQDIQKVVDQQQVGNLLKLSSDRLFDQLTDWMPYLGLGWYHALDKTKVFVPDPTAYLKRNLNYLFNEKGEKILLKELIGRLAKKCPLFETGHFRETVEAAIGQRQPNYLSTSTAFALFRLQDEGYIKLLRDSDADLMILPKAKGEIDDSSRVSHVVLN